MQIVGEVPGGHREGVVAGGRGEREVEVPRVAAEEDRQVVVTAVRNREVDVAIFVVVAGDNGAGLMTDRYDRSRGEVAVAVAE